MPEAETHPAIPFVKSLHPKGKGFRLDRTRRFLNGEVIYVVYVDEEGDEITDVVYREGNSIEYLMLPEDVIAKVNDTLRVSVAERLTNALLNIGGITGILALLMTIAVIYMAITERAIPDILEKALILAFGFYFGKIKTA